MRYLFLIFVTWRSAVHASCPDEFNLVRDGECRGFAAKFSASYEDAYEKTAAECDKIGGKPVTIHTEEEQQYWMARKDEIDARIILGLVCNATSGHVEWMDGSPVDYIPSGGGIDDLKYCYSGCSWNLAPDGHYHSLCGSIVSEAIAFCTKQLEQPVPNNDGCDGFEDDSEDGVCYQIGATPQNWQDAQKTCKGFGADLASIHNGKENSFIRRLAVSKGAVNGVFLGGKAAGKLYGWSDGTDWDYANFKAGFPANGQGDCLSMDTRATAGDWMNTDCSSTMPIVCARGAKQHVCTSGPWQEGDIITSPGFPFDASIPCDYTFTVAVGRRVEVEVIFLEANSCCDNMVLYEGDNIVANVAGEVTNKVYKTRSSNVMRVSWQPTGGGVNVRGIMITFRAV